MEQILPVVGQVWKKSRSTNRETVYVDVVKGDKVVIKRNAEAADSRTLHLNKFLKDYRL